MLSWVYSSSRPKNRGGLVVAISQLAFTADAGVDGGVDGNVLTALPLNWSVGNVTA